jgi:hypothetical protein
VRESSLPDAPAPAELLELQLQALYRIALEREEPELRVAAMQVLSEVSGTGMHSLREEDWQAWWEQRSQKTARGGAGP